MDKVSEAKLRAWLFIVLNNHGFNHQGQCECGTWTGQNPQMMLDHLEDELVKKLLPRINGKVDD